jgi:3-oxoadipate enol-lactonase
MKLNNIEFSVNIKGSKTPFIWAHGLMGSMALEDSTRLFDWDGCAGLARCIRYDARGHGNTSGTLSPDDYNWPGLAGDMLGIADALGIDKFIAGGQSMGCATSLYAALASPQKITGLVLVNPPTAWESRAGQAAIYDFLAGVVEKDGLDALCGLMLQTPSGPSFLQEAAPSMMEARLAGIKKMDAAVVTQIFRGAGLCDLPARDEIRKLTMPALILAWAGDSIHPVSTAEELHKLMPGSQLVIAEDMAGVIKWSGLIKEFITTLSAHN